MTGTLRRYDQLTQILLSKREPNAGAWRGVERRLFTPLAVNRYERVLCPLA